MPKLEGRMVALNLPFAGEDRDIETKMENVGEHGMSVVRVQNNEVNWMNHIGMEDHPSRSISRAKGS